MARALWDLFSSVDLLLTPMLATAPPPIGAMPTTGDDVDAHWLRMGSFAPFAALANVAGTPALSVPVARDRTGLPIAVQIVGPMGSDARLLQCGRRLILSQAAASP